MTSQDRPIGGYFELELSQGTEFHSKALALNTGRNSLEYVLQARGYRHVYLPYYSCDVLLEPFKKLGVDFSFYHVDDHLEINAPVSLDKDEAILYIDYYGLKQEYVSQLAKVYGNRLVMDNTQAFFTRPITGVDTFYSCRKFFGVADGAYLYCSKRLDKDLEQDQSWIRMSYLHKRIDVSPEAAFNDFRRNDEQLKDNPIRTMSTLTHRIMASINYQQVALRRRENYQILENALKDRNGISLHLDEDAVPMVYPFFTDDNSLRQRLIDNKIYVAQYWPNVLDWCDESCNDYKLTKHLLPLPVDQRYGEDEMLRILTLI